MPRAPLIRSAEMPYHVTNRSNNKEWFYIPMEDVWRIFTGVLSMCTERYGVLVHAFVLMSNHFHLILQTPYSNLDAMMRYFETESAKAIQRQAGRINHIFGTRYKWSLLESPTAVAFAQKYVIRNPVRAGICESVEVYPYSSIHPEALRVLPLVSGISPFWCWVPRDQGDLLQWLNQPSHKEAEELIAKGLKRSRFKFSQGNSELRRLRQLESEYGLATAPATFSAEK